LSAATNPAEYVRPGLPRRGGLPERRLFVIAPFRAQLIWVRPD